MSDIGDKFFSALIKSKNLDEFIRLGRLEHLFDHVDSDSKTFSKFSGFISKYGKIPSREAFEELIERDLPKAKETPRYYYDQILNRHVRKGLIKAGQLANELLEKKEVLKAHAVLVEQLQALGLDQISPKLYDFRQSHSLLSAELAKKKQIDYGVKLGWPSFDEMSGGLRGGDLVSFVGRPAAGKTFLGLHSALTVWQEQKKPVLFVSMEMKPIIIFERLAAMYQHIPYNWVKLGEFPTIRKNTKDIFLKNILKLESGDMPPFYVVDGDLTATVTDIANLCFQLKPSALFVDGAYLVETTSNKFKAEHEKVGVVCNTFKNGIATALDIPVITSWQFNRDSTKIKKSEKAGLQHIAYSDKVGQLSSIVLGLFQEESVETLRQREIRILKGRSGESGEYTINWNFQSMDFSEIELNNDYEINVT